VAEHEVYIFDLIYAVVGDHDAQIDEVLQITSVQSGEPDGDGAGGPGHLDGIQHIGGLAAPADANDDVSGFNVVLQLLSKNIILCLHQFSLSSSSHFFSVVFQLKLKWIFSY